MLRKLVAVGCLYSTVRFMARFNGFILLLAVLSFSCTDDLSPGESLTNYGMNSSVKNKFLFYKQNGGSGDYYFQLELDAKPDFGGRDVSGRKVRFDYNLRIRGDRNGAPINEAVVKFQFEPFLDDFDGLEFTVSSTDDEDIDYSLTESENETELVYMRYHDEAGLWSSADTISILIDADFEFRVDKSVWGEFRDAAEYEFTVP